MSGEKYLIVVVGPTAVGKTTASIRLAQHFKTEIVSADSRQFYKEMEIGTAKPSKEELETVKHHFIDSHSIKEDVSAGQFEKLALDRLAEIFKRNKMTVLTGGSGLYVKAITNGLGDIPVIDPQVRETLNLRLEKEGLEKLVKELKQLDPVYHAQVDLNNPQRVIRALEVCEGAGQPFSSFRKGEIKDRPFRMIKIGLERPREELYQRIDNRMDLMVDQGLFEEAKSLFDFKDHNAMQTVGYKEVFDFIDGIYDKEEAIRLLKRNSRRYAKRQMTWFKKDESTQWFHPDQLDEIISYIDDFLGR